MGFSLLGVGTVTRFSGPVLSGGGNPQSVFSSERVVDRRGELA